MGESAVLLAALGIVATTVGGLIWLLKEQHKQNNTILKDNTKATKDLTSTLTSIDKSLSENRKADREFQKTTLKYLTEISEKADRNHKYVQKIAQQTVMHQTVVSRDIEGEK